MPDYRFTIHGDKAAEPVTVSLPDDSNAWDYGESLVRFLLRDIDIQRDTWILEITQADRQITTIGFDLPTLRERRTFQ
jgi:hypothetical protein